MTESLGSAPVKQVERLVRVERKNGYLFIILALVLALVTITGFALLNGQNAKKSDLASQTADINKLYVYLRKACGVKDPQASSADAQLNQACDAVAKGAPPPQVLPSIPEPKSTTIIIRQVLPDSTISQILSAYCAKHNGCRGANGKPGAGLTQQQAVEAVTQYCSGHNECRGLTGQPGQDAPPPTDDQLATAVAVYCEAHNGCVGPQGPQGPQGEPGKDGQMPTRFVLNLNGVDNTCTRGPDAPDGTARYECVVSGTTPTPTPTATETGIVQIPGTGGNR